MKIKKTILVINLTFFHIISSDGLSIFFKNNAFIIKNKKETIKKICLNPLIIQPSIDKYFEDREKLLSNKEFFKNFMPVIINKEKIEQFKFIEKVNEYYKIKFLKAYWIWEYYKKFIKKHFLKEELLKEIGECLSKD